MAFTELILKDALASGEKIPENMQITLSFKEALIKATYHNKFELVRKLIECDEFDESIIHDIGLLDAPFPLYYITMCYKRTMWEDFIKKTMPFVEKQRIDIDKLLQLWKERFGANVDEVIDYKKYEAYFYCLSDDETDRDVLLNPRSKYTENGCRELDIDLFIAVDKFLFSKVKELLEKGANPNVNLVSIDDKDKEFQDPWNCLERIGNESGYLCTCQIFPIIKEPQGAVYLNWPISDKDIGDLIGWAAHENMYHLLELYDKTEES